jgi:hypothetical protein
LSFLWGTDSSRGLYSVNLLLSASAHCSNFWSHGLSYDHSHLMHLRTLWSPIFKNSFLLEIAFKY